MTRDCSDGRGCFRPMQCDSHIPETDVTSTDKSNKEIEKLGNHIERLDEVFTFTKRAGLNNAAEDAPDIEYRGPEIELDESAVPQRGGTRRMTPQKSDAYRKQVETLLEHELVEPSRSPWACGMVMAKKKEYQLRFCCEFQYLNSVTMIDAFPNAKIDERLSKLGNANFFYDT